MDKSLMQRLLGSKKSARIHPTAVTVKYGSHFPQRGDESYDDAPSFEDFGTFMAETSDRKQLSDSKAHRTVFNLRSEPRSRASKGVRGQLESFSEASVLSSRVMWAALFVAALAHGCVSLLTRLAADLSRVPSLELLFVRSVLQVLSVAVVLYHKEAPFGPRGCRLHLFSYGIFNVISISCAYTSFALVPPANGAIVWRASVTVFSAVLSFLLVDERLGATDTISVSCSVFGLGLILIPNLASDEKPLGFWKEAFGYVLMVLAGVMAALSMILYRCVKQQVSVWTALFTFGWMGSLWSCCSMFLLQEPVIPHDAETWIFLLSICFCSTVAFLGVYYGLQRLHPALVSTVQHLELVVAMILQLLVLRILPSACDIIGAVVIIVSVLALGLVKVLRGGKRETDEYEEILDSSIK
ncbi:solute carrier family 35 member G2 [Pangasianodon hypophthalmus]|uniref:solute carrier family 35 member G2 n=1 Tax=Pangasianodon hypophthalmus TaxID=310915 RepID=UPI002307DAAC|nr:solute carrier family 35 member G2 [Pangasianodon hypophthalmus]XP_053095556.1 solute carrier family 35 member G2 [Pangasianodon hypophthalmus]